MINNKEKFVAIEENRNKALLIYITFVQMESI